MNIEVNYLAVLLAGVGSMAVGFFWYSPAFMGKPWMELMGYTSTGLKKAQQEMGKLYAVSFVLALVMAYVLSHVMVMSQNFFHYSRLFTGVSSALWMWLGFVLPVQTTDTIFTSKKWKLLAINTSYQLVALLVAGIVLGLM